MDYFSVAAVAKYHAEAQLPTTAPPAVPPPPGLAARAKLLAPPLLFLMAWWPMVEFLSRGETHVGPLLTRKVEHVPALALTGLVGGSALLGVSGGEAGGAVVLPLAVLWLDVQLDTVREVVLLSRSAGLALLALGLLASRQKVVWNVFWGGVAGGWAGWALGVFLVTPAVQGEVVLVGLAGVNLLAGLAGVLLRKGSCRERDRAGWRRAAVMMGAGLIGGVLMSLSGFGVDLVVFLAMRLIWGLDRKDAARTAVMVASVVMGGASIGSFWIGEGLSASGLALTVSSLPVVVCAVPAGFLIGECLLAGWFLSGWLIVTGLSSSIFNLYKLQPWESSSCLTQYEVIGVVLVVIFGVLVTRINRKSDVEEEPKVCSESDQQRNIPKEAKVMQDLLGGVRSLNKQDSRQNIMRSAQSVDQVPSYISFIEWVRANGPDNVPRGFH